MTAPHRTERLTVRLRPHEKEAVEDAAHARRCTLSELARRAIIEEARAVLAAGEGGDDE